MGTATNAPAEEDLHHIGIQERSELIDRIAASSQFRRSARLRDFLLYVGRQSLKDGCPEIHEQEIGARVFGRPAHYDRSQDNIVRVNATELRKRIDQYFITDGAHETLIMEIPRGGYRPVFRRRATAATTVTALAPVTEPETPQVLRPLPERTALEPRQSWSGSGSDNMNLSKGNLRLADRR